LTLHIKGIVRR